jgi:small subunit ribosomal protein S2
LTQTRIQIKKAQLCITLLRSSGKRVLFVSNEAHTLQIVERRRRATCSFFVNGRWLGGTLTNLATIQASLRMLVPKPGEGKTTTSQSIRESNKIATRRSRRQRYLDGLIGLNSIPGAVIILTQKTSLVAINECRKLGIPTISLVDTDCDLNLTTINIPINDDSSPRIHLFLEAILPSISVGRRWWLSIKVQAHKTSRGKWKSRNRMHLLK